MPAVALQAAVHACENHYTDTVRTSNRYDEVPLLFQHIWVATTVFRMAVYIDICLPFA
jgi:hypothetical protein